MGGGVEVCTRTADSEIVVGEESSGREMVDWWGGGEAVLKCLEGLAPAVAMRGSAAQLSGGR